MVPACQMFERQAEITPRQQPLAAGDDVMPHNDTGTDEDVDLSADKPHQRALKATR